MDQFEDCITLLALRKIEGRAPPSTKPLSPLAVVEAHIEALTEQLYEVEDITAELEDMEAEFEGMLTNPVVLTNICLVRDRYESSGRFISKDLLDGGGKASPHNEQSVSVEASAKHFPALEPDAFNKSSESSLSAFLSPFAQRSDNNLSEAPLIKRAATRFDLTAKSLRRNLLGKSSPRDVHGEPAAAPADQHHTSLSSAMKAAPPPTHKVKRSSGLQAASTSFRGIMQGLMGEVEEEVVEVVGERRRPASVFDAVASARGDTPQMRSVFGIAAGITPPASAQRPDAISYAESKGTRPGARGAMSFRRSNLGSGTLGSFFGNDGGEADDEPNEAPPGPDQRLRPRNSRRRSRVIRPHSQGDVISSNGGSAEEKPRPSVTRGRSRADLLRNAHSTTFKREDRSSLQNDAVIAFRQREAQQVRSILKAPPPTAPPTSNGSGAAPSSSTGETNILVVDHGSASDVPVEVLTDDDGPSSAAMANGVDDVVEFVKDEGTLHELTGGNTDDAKGSSQDSLPGKPDLDDLDEEQLQPSSSGSRIWHSSSRIWRTSNHATETGNPGVLVDHDTADVPVETLLEPEPSFQTIKPRQSTFSNLSWTAAADDTLGQGAMGNVFSGEGSLESLPGQPDQGQHQPMIAGTHVTSYVVHDDDDDDDDDDDGDS